MLDNHKINESWEDNRIELCVHTSMGDGTGIVSVEEIIDRAFSLRHPGIAITDYMSVASFPKAFEAASKYTDFKLIYGMVANIVTDQVHEELSAKYRPPFGSEDRGGFSLEWRSFHATILVKNKIGRRNLYQLLSEKEFLYPLRYVIRHSKLDALREGLLIGSGDYRGELMSAILQKKSEDEILEIVGRYDYLEIQPIDNCRRMIYENYAPLVSTYDLQQANREIVELGKRCGKLVVATGNVCFLDEKDKRTHAIMEYDRMRASQRERLGLIKERERDSRFFHTTEEMLDEFKDMPKDLAYQVVVDNTQRIAAMIDAISPVEEQKSWIKGADDSYSRIKKVCKNRLVKLYGEHPSILIEQRLNDELSQIKSNNYALFYERVMELVQAAHVEGAATMIRGLSGGSFVSYLLEITELNPLPAHYRCKCGYHEFSDRKDSCGRSMVGFDLPQRECPKCGVYLIGDGYNISYEFFMGLKGERRPRFWIDVSPSNRDSVIARLKKKYPEVYCSTWLHKSSRSYEYSVKGYFDAIEKKCTSDTYSELNEKLEGIKKNYMIHPGGIVFGAASHEIYQYAPLVRVMKTEIRETATLTGIRMDAIGFEKSFIEDYLLCIMLLKKRDCEMLSLLEQTTSVQLRDIPMNDTAVLSLFHSVEALEITPADINGFEIGTMGIRNFPSYIMEYMLCAQEVTSYTELVRVYASGCNLRKQRMYLGELLMDKRELIEMFGGKEDIFDILLSYGVERERAFDIVADIDQGKGLSFENNRLMVDLNMPKKFIHFCNNQMEGLHSKSHAASLVLSDYRLAYYKLHYPLKFYAAYYSTVPEIIDYDMTRLTIDEIEIRLKEISADNESKRSERGIYNIHTVLMVMLEMYKRGIHFCDLDIEIADAHMYKVVDGKIMPSLESLNLEEGDRYEIMELHDIYHKEKSIKELVALYME